MTGECGNFAGRVPNMRTSAEQMTTPAVASTARQDIVGRVFRLGTVLRDRLNQYVVEAANHPELEISKVQVPRC
jgi:hypothetical protein